MTTYTKSLSVDFGGNLNSSQLHSEIDYDVTITTTINGINVSGDVVDIIFASSLSAPELSQLDVLIAAHTPYNFNTSLHEDTVDPTSSNDEIQGFSSGTSRWINTATNRTFLCIDASVGAAVWKQISNLKPAHTIVVSQDGEGDYTTVKAAVLAAGVGDIITIKPGTYVEVNPIEVPDDVSVNGDSVANVIIVGAVPTTHIFKIGHNCVVGNMTVLGANATGGVGLYYDAAGSSKRSLIERVQITGCETGLLVDMTTYNPYLPALMGTELFIGTSDIYTVDYGIKVLNGGVIRFTSCALVGNPINGMKECIHIEGVGSSCQIQDSGISYADVGVSISDGGEAKLSGGICYNNKVVMQVESNGDLCQLDAIGVLMDDTTNYDLNVLSTKVDHITLGGCRLSSNKINNPNGVKIFCSFADDDEENQSQTILGALNVGTHLLPSDSYFGMGGARVSDTCVLHYDGATFTNITEITHSSGGSTFTGFVGVTTGNILYVGGDSVFSGLKVLVDQLIDYGTGTVEVEYGTTGGWFDAGRMWSIDTPPYNSLAQNPFTNTFSLTEPTYFNLRFDNFSGWEKITIDTMEKYWVRFRISSDITTTPLLEQIKLYGNCKFINMQGITEYFGHARPRKRLTLDMDSVNANFDQNIFLSDSLISKNTRNGFTSSQNDLIGLTTILPYEIDTSCPFILKWSWYATTNTGNVKWNVRFGTSKNGDVIYEDLGSAPTSTASEELVTLTETVPGTANTQYTSQVNLKICCVLPEDILWISLQREGTTDTCTGNVVIIKTMGFYVARSDGYYV